MRDGGIDNVIAESGERRKELINYNTVHSETVKDKQDHAPKLYERGE
jgi:hypothetical protein